MNPPFRFNPDPLLRLQMPAVENSAEALPDPSLIQVNLRVPAPDQVVVNPLSRRALQLVHPSLQVGSTTPGIQLLGPRHSRYTPAPPWDGIDEPDWVQTVVELIRGARAITLHFRGMPTYNAIQGCHYPQFMPNGTLDPGDRRLCTEAYTYANMYIEVRPDRNIGESVVNNFNVEYVGADFVTPHPLDSSAMLPLLLPALGPGILGARGFRNVMSGGSPSAPDSLGTRSETPINSSVALCHPGEPCTWSLWYLLTGATSGPAQGREQAMIQGFWTALGFVVEWYRRMGLPDNQIFAKLNDFVEHIIRPFLHPEGRRALGLGENTWNANPPLFSFGRMHNAIAQILLDSRHFYFPDLGQMMTFSAETAQAELTQVINEIQSQPVPTEAAALARREERISFFTNLRQVYATKHVTNLFTLDGDTVNERGEKVMRMGFFAPAMSLDFSLPNGITLQSGRVMATEVQLEMPRLHDIMTNPLVNPWDSNTPWRLLLNHPYLAQNSVGQGAMRLNVQSVRADRIEVNMPSLRQLAHMLHIPRNTPLSRLTSILERHWNEIIHLCDVKLVAPHLDDSYSFIHEAAGLNVRGQGSSLTEGRVTFESSTVAANVVAHLHEVGGWVESFEFSSGNIGPLRLRDFDINGINLSMGAGATRMQVQRVRSETSGSYADTAALPTRLDLQGGLELTNVLFESTTPAEGENDTRLEFDIPELSTRGVFRRENLTDIQLNDLSIRNGRFVARSHFPGSTTMGNYSLDLVGDVVIDGNFDFHSNFNIPTYDFNGYLHGTRFEGPAHLLFAHDQTLVERRPGATQNLTLSTHITHGEVDGVRRDSRVVQVLQTNPGSSQRARTSVAVDAQVHVRNANRLAFFTPAGGPEHMEMDLQGVEIADIHSGGEIWAPLPIWGDLRAILATGAFNVRRQAGRPGIPAPRSLGCDTLPGGIPPLHHADNTRNNFIFIEDWNIHPNNGHFENEWTDARACLVTNPLDEGGSTSFLSLSLPHTWFTPGMPDPLRMENMYVDTNATDLLRGGWMLYSTDPRRIHLYDRVFPSWSTPGRRN